MSFAIPASSSSDKALDRGRLEQYFFDTVSPYNKVEKDKVGMETLRVRIQDILSDLVRQEFPKVWLGIC